MINIRRLDTEGPRKSGIEFTANMATGSGSGIRPVEVVVETGETVIDDLRQVLRDLDDAIEIPMAHTGEPILLKKSDR